jgi:hypothetical protein
MMIELIREEIYCLDSFMNFHSINIWKLNKAVKKRIKYRYELIKGMKQIKMTTIMVLPHRSIRLPAVLESGFLFIPRNFSMPFSNKKTSKNKRIIIKYWFTHITSFQFSFRQWKFDILCN